MQHFEPNERTLWRCTRHQENMTKVSKMFKGSSIEFGKCISSFIIRIKRSKKLYSMPKFHFHSIQHHRLTSIASRWKETLRLDAYMFGCTWALSLLNFTSTFSLYLFSAFQSYPSAFSAKCCILLLLPFQLSQQLTQGMRYCVHTLQWNINIKYVIFVSYTEFCEETAK